MKHCLLAAALLFSASVPASADVRFLGGFNTTSATNCAYSTAGDQRISRYRPPGVAGNPTAGGLSMPFVGGGFNVEFPGPHPALNVFQNVSAVEQGAFGFDVYNTRIKFTFMSPSTITASTRFVSMRGVIEEPFGEKFSPGLCTVGFEASFVKAN
jgi:hypothetical protein